MNVTKRLVAVVFIDLVGGAQRCYDIVAQYSQLARAEQALLSSGAGAIP